MLSFVAHMVSETAMQHCLWSVETAIDNLPMSICVPVQLHLQKQEWARFDPGSVVYQPLAT